MNLYRKLLLAQAPIAVALAIVGVFSAAVVSYLGSHSQTILKDNYRSVLAAQRMKEAIERMDSGALFIVAGERQKGLEQAEKNRPIFEAELKVQVGNITESGEKEFTEGLRAAWMDYQAKFARLQNSTSTEEAKQIYFSELEARFYKVKAADDEILAINQDAMVRKSGEVRRTAERMNTITISVALAALALGLLVSTFLTRRMLQPVLELSEATRKIGEGRFDARAHVRGNDELAQLARDFNAMAGRLAEYRKSSLGDLLQAHLSMQAAIDSLPDPVVIFNVDGNLQNVNLAAETLLGVRTDSGSKESLKNVETSTRAVLERIRSHVLSGKGTFVPRGFEDAVQLTTLLGDRYFLPRGAPVYETRGVIVGATVILQDVTRLRRFEELKSDLVATVAHEFRTPLTSLRMAVHLCTEQVAGPLTDKQAELLHSAREDCDRLQGLIDDLLDMSRIESGRVELFPLPTEAASLITAAVDEYKAEAEAKGVILNAQVTTSEVSVLADRERIGHVFSNLIGNAVRYTPKGGSIILDARVANGTVRFTVADTGTGIPKEYQDRIFEKFFQVPDAKTKGTGLGL
ncbi:MAG TPA: histidine kinase dimerization/phospho-acceptor domain-containing protein, partial [Candidatus Binatia bacterium]|nr:histidine kinase dimerization/phospho-acceptor domain-containing protein [Candidatus Binatia bacterium]